MKFKPLPITKISLLIEERLKEAILDGKLCPGERLPTEKEIAVQFAVSIVPVREALKGLEVIGLIKRKRGQKGGAYISEINNDVIKTSLHHYLTSRNLSTRQLYDVRKIIEPPAARLAALEITHDAIRALEENASYCEERLKNAGSLFDEEVFFDVEKKHTDFHRIIAEIQHNPILSLTVDYVLDFLSECETRILRPDFDYSMNTLKDHRIMLEVLKQADGEKCEKQMIFHLERLQQYLTEIEERNRNTLPR